MVEVNQEIPDRDEAELRRAVQGGEPSRRQGSSMKLARAQTRPRGVAFSPQVEIPRQQTRTPRRLAAEQGRAAWDFDGFLAVVACAATGHDKEFISIRLE